MPNKRVYYAIREPLIAPLTGFTSFNSSHFAHGVQSAGTSVNFRLEQVFQLGQNEIYENIEEIPDIEFTSEKVLDGYPLLMHLATYDGVDRTLGGRSNARCLIGLSIFDDTKDSTSGTALAVSVISGAYWSASSFNIPVQGNMTESFTAVCNNRRWYNSAGTAPAGSMSGWMGAGISHPDSPIGSGGVQRRENLKFDYTASAGTDGNGLPIYTSGCTLPRQIPGIDSSGRNYRPGNTGDFPAHLQNVRVGVNLGREEIFELGRRAPFHRYVRFPVECTAEVEILSVSGDWIEATEEGALGGGTNLQNESFRIVTDEGTRISLGTACKLASVTSGGGDTGGANETYTYNYSTFNNFTVMHSGDPNTSLRASTFAVV